MRINDNLYVGIDQSEHQLKMQDPFHLDFQITDVTIQHHGHGQAHSNHVGCTPWCDPTGTGNSYCCTCK